MNDDTTPAETPVDAAPVAAPNETDGDASQDTSKDAARPGKRTFLVVILLLIFTSLALQSPREVSRWYLAAGREKHVEYKRLASAARRLRAEADQTRSLDHGEAADSFDNRAAELEDDAQQAFQSAVGLVERAAEWAPEDPQPDQQLAEWYFYAGKYEPSLEFFDRLVELRPNDPQSYERRAIVRLEQRQYRDAVPDADKALRLAEQGDSTPLYQALNEAAYARALAGMELERALDDANQAVDIIRAAQLRYRPSPADSSAERTLPRRFDSTLAATLDTRGLIHYKLGNLETARDDLNEAIDLHQRYLRTVAKRLLASDPLEAPVLRNMLTDLSESLGVMLYHRGLVLKKMGDIRRAKQDLAQAAEHGFDVERGH